MRSKRNAQKNVCSQVISSRQQKHTSKLRSSSSDPRNPIQQVTQQFSIDVSSQDTRAGQLDESLAVLAAVVGQRFSEVEAWLRCKAFQIENHAELAEIAQYNVIA